MVEPVADAREMTLLEHLDELRTRLIRCLVGVGVGFAASYAFSQQLLDFFLAPLRRALPEGAVVQYTGLPEPFFVHLKIAALAGFFLATPWIFYQIWRFVAPGLYRREQRLVLPFVFFSTLFFSAGSVFCFHFVFPTVFEFFVKTFSVGGIEAIPRLGEYFSFATKLLLAFGLAFELPVVCFFLGRLGLITWQGMLRAWRWVTIGIFVVAAILTPPDVVSQMMLAMPLMVLYGFSVAIVAATGHRPVEVPGSAPEA